MSTGLVSGSPAVGANVHSKTIHSIIHFILGRKEKSSFINTVLVKKKKKVHLSMNCLLRNCISAFSYTK